MWRFRFRTKPRVNRAVFASQQRRDGHRGNSLARRVQFGQSRIVCIFEVIIKNFAEPAQRIGVLGAAGQVIQFVGVVFKVV